MTIVIVTKTCVNKICVNKQSDPMFIRILIYLLFFLSPSARNEISRYAEESTRFFLLLIVIPAYSRNLRLLAICMENLFLRSSCIRFVLNCFNIIQMNDLGLYLWLMRICANKTVIKNVTCFHINIIVFEIRIKPAEVGA